MTYEELLTNIDNTSWFTNSGSYRSSGNTIGIPSLSAWNDTIFEESLRAEMKKIASSMDWFPSSRDQKDPFHGQELTKRVAAVEGGKTKVMAAYKVASKKLSNYDKTKFVSGPHDYSITAKSAALYCVRMAAMECLSNNQGVWVEVFKVYSQGYWPCGLLPDNKLVVY
ncbi:hypothetical protein LRP50_24925 [Enterovibrio sp. ZSDZ42]|uniref:Uncharacterized protein n=1 Tax=Enterovibrio gelatinilyticus TaxID=2899819 RepID=A0ABT5R7Y1_9GAMM|nr:hypothetical protein [Enterovibrio sp. ZSDZ42]MDD1796368.1 hypothetical protein [Enterovibrio sp. ZSDZ42]